MTVAKPSRGPGGRVSATRNNTKHENRNSRAHYVCKDVQNLTGSVQSRTKHAKTPRAAKMIRRSVQAAPLLGRVPTSPRFRPGCRHATLEAGENKSGHINAGPNEGILFFD
ncbi:hypothetical protein LTR28_001042, partial [Elasticomyces elasticus]